MASDRSLVVGFGFSVSLLLNLTRDVVAHFDKTSVFELESPTRSLFGKASSGV